MTVDKFIKQEIHDGLVLVHNIVKLLYFIFFFFFANRTLWLLRNISPTAAT